MRNGQQIKYSNKGLRQWKWRSREDAVRTLYKTIKNEDILQNMEINERITAITHMKKK